VEFNLADLFESLADAIGERPALVAGQRRLTYAELDARANRLANFLRSRGVGPGSHVGLHLFNGTEFVEAMLAVFKVRAVPININYRYVEDELGYLCENAELTAILSQREFAGVIGSVAARCPALRTIILLEDGSEGSRAAGGESFDYETVLSASSPARDFAPRSGDDRYIIYTGGTTGMPKGVVWRQEDVFFAGLQGGNPGGVPIEKPEELAQNVVAGRVMSLTMLPAAPLIHGAAQWTVFICLFTGGKVVLQPGRSFDAERVVALIGEEKVTTLTLVGDAMARPIVEVLSAPGKSYDMSSLFVVASAGAVLSPTVKEQLRAVLPNVMVINSFGSSESGHQGSAMPGSETGAEGRPSFFMDPRTNVVVDDDLEPIEPGSGKIGWLARGGRVPLGYFRDDEKTASRFVTIKGQRWVLAGDHATVEADGRITVYGRGSGCINTGGEKVFPEEVEEVLKSHPDVFDALVIGVDDPRWMQRVVAVVEPRAGKQPTLEALQEHCRAHIAGYKVPRQLTLVDKVARFATGKPDYTWAKDVARGAP
jgi:acyl-CoA synthetase (AMP-forming)/AMP-acid ligase II